MRRIRNPETYVEPKSAAQLLRQIADDLDKRPDDAWVSMRINSAFASRSEVERALAPKPNSLTTKRRFRNDNTQPSLS